MPCFRGALSVVYWLRLDLHRILAPANPESSHFLEIQPSPALAEFLAGFGGCQCSCNTFS